MIIRKNILGDSIGEIELVDSMGSDLTVVNSARISFGGKSESINKKDKKLIEYLAKNEHTSPFRHSFLSFRIKAPEMIMRQWYKHVIGCSWTAPEFHNHGWNEISGRYIEVEPEFYHVKTYRKQSEDNKQGSDGKMEKMPNTICRAGVHEGADLAFRTDKMMLELGASKEQARMVLPLSLYTEVIWTGSLQAMHNFVKLRDHEHAQEEIRLYAQAISSVCETKFPYSWEALTG